jgi:hypothetical protein
MVRKVMDSKVRYGREEARNWYVHNRNITPFLRFLEFLVFGGARFAGQGAFATLASSKWAVPRDVTGVIAAEADGQFALGGSVSRFATGVAKGGGLTVARLVVVPATGLAIKVVLHRRWWRREIFEDLGKGVKGFFSLGVFLGVVSPLHLDDDPFKGVSPGEVFQYFLAVLLRFIQLIVCLLDQKVKLSLPQL